jgi:hypothetical protein
MSANIDYSKTVPVFSFDSLKPEKRVTAVVGFLRETRSGEPKRKADSACQKTTNEVTYESCEVDS